MRTAAAPAALTNRWVRRDYDHNDSECSTPAKPSAQLRILLVASLRWPLAARVAIAFHKLGCSVQAWCPSGHPLEKTHAIEHIYRSTALMPLRSLRAAIEAAAPDLLIPCDDDAAIYLHRLHQQSLKLNLSAPMRKLIEHSLGTPASCSLATARADLMHLAAAEGVRVPETTELSSLADLENWRLRNGFPAVIKVDRSWGGRGVTLVRDIAEARRAFQIAKQSPLMPMLSQLILRRDISQLLRWFALTRPIVTIQKFIAGSSANRAVACWQGNVLAGISAMALETQGPTGPATVVKIIDNEAMTNAARQLVRALGLSGLCGLDFVIEASTGHAYLIELNPRATPMGQLAPGRAWDLPAVLHAHLQGEPAPDQNLPGSGEIIAMFPGEWRRNLHSHYLDSAFHDVPWTERELVQDCLMLPWEDRGLVARIRARLKPGRAQK